MGRTRRTLRRKVRHELAAAIGVLLNSLAHRAWSKTMWRASGHETTAGQLPRSQVLSRSVPETGRGNRMSLIVFGTSVSPFVRKVRIVLTEKGLLYRHENVNVAKPPDGWRELSPLGKIPAFKDCDRALAGSSVICAYLEHRFPMPPLYPSEALRLCACAVVRELHG